MFDASEYNSRAKGAQQTYQLSDGGVYDNLGVEPLRDRDDAAVPARQRRRRAVRREAPAAHVAARHDPRDQGDRPRGAQAAPAPPDRQLPAAAQGCPVDDRHAAGTYADDAGHGVAMAIDDFLPVSEATRPTLPATVSTRLARLDDERRWQLIDWGYASADAGLRKYTDLVATDAAGTPPSVQRGRRAVTRTRHR